MNSKRRSFLALVLAAMCFSCSGKKEGTAANAGAAQGEPPSRAADATSAVAGRNAQAGNLDELVDVIVAEAAELPRSEFEPAALAQRLGKDPQAHFNWVRDNTWWAPYRGLLRGSKGVMLDRVGSSLDRSVLLGDLLRHSGFTVRLAHANLPEEIASELLAKVRPMPKQRRKSSVGGPSSVEREKKLESLIPGYQDALRQQTAEVERISSDAKSLVSSEGNRLYAAVRGTAGDSGRADSAAAISAIRDHWWVERREGDKWVAMDVLLGDGKTGYTHAPASGYSDWKPEVAAPLIPDAEWHAVRIRVVVERYESGETKESTALETVLHPAEVLERPIMLGHVPRPWPESLPVAKSDPNALGNTAVNVKEWLPYLRVGDEFLSQSAFTESGDLISNPLSTGRDIAATGGGGFMSGFGEALGGGGETAPSSLTAEWIDYEIRVPGQAPRVIRRPVFDVLGPAKRSAGTESFDAATNELLVARYGALLSTTGIFLQPCELTGEYVANLTSAGIVENRDAFHALAREGDPATARRTATELLARLGRWGPLPGLALWRSAFTDNAGDWFINEPNILNYRMSPPVVNADRVPWRALIDVASNEVGVRTGDGLNPFEVRVRRGVADTVAEIVALGGNVRDAANTASIYALTRPEDEVRIDSRGADAVRSLGWSGDAAARLAADVEGGFTAVAPARPVSVQGDARLGWWRIDPNSGSTIGVMDSGYNGTDEPAEINSLVAQLQNFLRQYPMPPTSPGFPPPTVADAMKWAVVVRAVAETLVRAGACVPFVNC